MQPWAQYLIGLLVLPLLGACLWSVLARGWALVVYNGDVPERWIRRRRAGSKIMAIVLYLAGIIIGIAQHRF